MILLNAASPAPAEPSSGRGLARRVLTDIDALDRAMYAAVVSTPTPALDRPLSWIADASSFARLWIATSIALAAGAGRHGRRTAALGMTAVGVTSLTADLFAKHLVPRRRPAPDTVSAGRKARRPTSSSFPSGHTASAFAYASTVATGFPDLALPLYGMATVVGCSRVHTGVHYPSDVVGGAILGLCVGAAMRRWPSR
jgi:undecaprenyl-diphosphatase